MPDNDDTPRCSYCGSPGDFRGNACYGCIQLRELTRALRERAYAILTLRDWINERPELNTHSYIRDRLTYEYTQLNATIASSLKRYDRD